LVFPSSLAAQRRQAFFFVDKQSSGFVCVLGDMEEQHEVDESGIQNFQLVFGVCFRADDRLRWRRSKLAEGGSR